MSFEIDLCGPDGKFETKMKIASQKLITLVLNAKNNPEGDASEVEEIEETTKGRGAKVR